MEKNQEDSEDDQIDTNHCPVCSKKCKKLLLHLNKAENCKTNVCPDFHLKLQQMSKLDEREINGTLSKDSLFDNSKLDDLQRLEAAISPRLQDSDFQSKV